MPKKDHRQQIPRTRSIILSIGARNIQTSSEHQHARRILVEKRTIRPFDSINRPCWTGGAIALREVVMSDVVATLHQSFGSYLFNGGKFNLVAWDQATLSSCLLMPVSYLNQSNHGLRVTTTATVMKTKMTMMIQRNTDFSHMGRTFLDIFVRLLFIKSFITNKPIFFFILITHRISFSRFFKSTNDFSKPPSTKTLIIDCHEHLSPI